MSAVHGFEDLYGIEIDPAVRALRRRCTAASGFQSHACTCTCCTAGLPGYPSALAMAAGSPWRRRAGLAIRRSVTSSSPPSAAAPVHPISVRIGGFSRAPRRRRPRWDRRSLDAAVDQARDNRSPRGVVGSPGARASPAAGRDAPPGRVPLQRRPDRVLDGLDLLARRLGRGVRRGACRGDQRLHARTHDGRVYLLGPTARIALASDQLHPLAAEALARPGLADAIGSTSTVRSSPARSSSSTPAPRPATSSTGSPAARAARRVHAATGVAAWSTEAPRGILHHRYEVDEREPGDPCPDRPADEPEPGCLEADLAGRSRRASSTSPMPRRPDASRC